MGVRRYDFASDNTAGISPPVCAALCEANEGSVASYGDDDWTRRLRDRVREIFEIDCDVYFVFNGTAANALALAQLCQPFNSVVCHEHAHIENDECGACEFFTNGSKLITTRGDNGKLDLRQVDIALARQHELHSHKPKVISITQATELGTVYSANEICVISDFAKRHGMLVHMDGARFANAVVTLACSPREITWQSGVDVLCFGGTKNGGVFGELVIFFDKRQSIDFDYRVKQAGQLASKMRFLAAPWLSLLNHDAWLDTARAANAAAQRLAAALRECGAEVLYPVEANSVFFRSRDAHVMGLRDRGWEFYKFIEPDVYRLMCSWSITDDAISTFARDFAESGSCGKRVG